jgi:hypothetical protein
MSRRQEQAFMNERAAAEPDAVAGAVDAKSRSDVRERVADIGLPSKEGVGDRRPKQSTGDEPS